METDPGPIVSKAPNLEEGSMRFKKVMLVNPKYGGRYYPMLPAGLGYVAESLVQAGVDYDYIDMGLNGTIRNLRNRMADFSPDLIGIQMMTFHYLQTYKLIRKIKEMFPQLLIVVGGPHVSTMRETVLEENESIDYAIVLEGERTIVELARGDVPTSHIKGLIFREEGKVKYTGDREFIKDLDSLPFPRYEKFPLAQYPHSSLPISSSRGCPYDCIFCPVEAAIGRMLRVRTAANVADELEYWYRRGYRKFDFIDDNFTFYKERIYQLCDEIDRRGMTGLDLACSNGVRADKVDRELLGRMRKVGFTLLAFGVEAGNNRILQMMKKKETIETIEKAIKDACELGFGVNLFFVIGTPGETEADIQDSMNLALKYPVADARFYNLVPFPKTELFKWVEERGYFIHPPSQYLSESSAHLNEPYFETPEFPYEARRRAFVACKQVTSRIWKAYIRRELAKHRIVADLCAYVYGTDFVQWRILTSPALRKLAKRVFYALR